MWAVIAVVLVAPWTEELWIAYNFGQLCRKDAGIFIYKTVDVEGFYDDTTGWGPRQLAESKYQFVESKDVLYKKLSRVERADNIARDRALAWYAEKNPGKERPKDLFLVYPVNDEETIVASPNGMDAWRVTKLAHPTARYHYSRDSGVQVAHNIGKQSSKVIDSETGKLLGRYIVYSRGAPWFFIHLSRPKMGCDGPDGGPDTKYKNSFLIYRDILKPIVRQ